MKNHKLIVALFIGVISAEQIPNINMIGAGMAHNDFLQVTKDTQAAKHHIFIRCRSHCLLELELLLNLKDPLAFLNN